MAAPLFPGPTISKRYTTLRDATDLLEVLMLLSQVSNVALQGLVVTDFKKTDDKESTRGIPRPRFIDVDRRHWNTIRQVEDLGNALSHTHKILSSGDTPSVPLLSVAVCHGASHL